MAGLGYWVWQQNQQLRYELSGAKSQIANLEHQLLAANVSANKQGEIVEQTLQDDDSEIHKLWGVSYDNNRKTIADNSDDLDELKEKLSVIYDDIANYSKIIKLQNDTFSDLDANYNQLITTIADLDQAAQPIVVDWASYQEKINDQADKIASLEKEVTSQTGNDEAQSLDIDALQEQVTQLANKPGGLNAAELSDLTHTVNKHQEALNSNDTFRSQLNRQILRLSKQINKLILQQQMSARSN